MKRLLSLCSLLTVLAMGTLSAQADLSAVVWSGGAGNSNYNDANNWTVVDPASFPTPTGDPNRVPASINGSRDEHAYIYNGSSVSVSTSMPPINQMTLGGPFLDVFGRPLLDPNGNPIASLPSSLTLSTGGRLILNSNGGGYLDGGGSLTHPYSADVTIGGGGGTLSVSGGSLVQSRGTYDVITIPYLTVGTDTGSTATAGVLNISSGNINSGSLRIGHGNENFLGESGKGNTSLAIVNQTGGKTEFESVAVGSNRSTSIYNMSGNSSVLVATGNFNVGSMGDIATFNQSGGSVSAGKTFRMERSTSVYNLSGGTLEIGKNWTPADGNDAIGSAGGAKYAVDAKFIMTGGYLHTVASKPRLGPMLSIADGGGATGLFRQTGGTVLLENSATNLYSIFVGKGDDSSYGTLDLQGGTFDAGGIALGYGGGHGIVTIGPSAKVSTTWFWIYNHRPPGSRVTFQMDSTGYGSINMKGGGISVDNSDTPVDMEALGGYRPKEGDLVRIFRNLDPDHSPAGKSYFTQMTTNITTGIAKDANGVDLPVWKAHVGGEGITKYGEYIIEDPDSPFAQSYVMTFQGLTHGDADGDHKVDGGDLTIMGTYWNDGASNHTWADGDFNADGTVDISDLTIMGTNWGWGVSPAPPMEGIPEPATLSLLALGGLAILRRRSGQVLRPLDAAQDRPFDIAQGRRCGGGSLPD